MLSCHQFQNQNVLEHGQSVANWYRDLDRHLTTGAPLTLSWRLPDWIHDPVIPVKLLNFDLLETYQVYHDCGKPFCRTVDENGKQHFPNHAEVSRRRWLECSDGSPEALKIADLIAMDMDAHLLKADGIAEFARREECVSLLLTALCEIHSNAEMFGGIESVGFKIKWKHLDKTGRRVLSLLRSDK
jgi:hypothetical protein